MLLRLLIAAVFVFVLWVVIPPFFHLLGFAGSGDLLTILRAVIAGLAILYVITGNKYFPGPA
jgi:hypothetical protein